MRLRPGGGHDSTRRHSGRRDETPETEGLVKTHGFAQRRGRRGAGPHGLIVRGGEAGTWNGSAYTAITGLVDGGRGSDANAQWNGEGGIITSDTRAVNNNDLVSIGVATASQVKGVASTATTTFAGQTVLGSDVLVMFTWGGDA